MTSKGRGPYFQLVESYRPEDARTPRTRVLVHLGEHKTPEAALASWPNEIGHLRHIGREGEADRLTRKLEKLRAFMDTEGKDR